MKLSISESQWRIFKILLDLEEITTDEIVRKSGETQPMVMGTITYGEERQWVVLNEQTRYEVVISENFKTAPHKQLPERAVLPLLLDKERTAMKELSILCKEKGIAMNEVVKWGAKRGWYEKDKGELLLTAKGKSATHTLDNDELLIEEALKSGSVFTDQLSHLQLDTDKAVEMLTNRHSVAKIKERKSRVVKLTEKGQKELTGEIEVVKEQNTLSSEDITSGRWKSIKLRPYDVRLEADKLYPAKIHPLQKIIQRTRKAFLEMGFTEIVSSQVESSFWVFDALFQPQDHPARDMQDTFYLQRPATAKLPDKELVEKIKTTHENGGTTGSRGWGYNWNSESAKKTVLRTHTTAASIRAISQDPNPPRKIFCVGKVFRNESISYKHLPEFFQVDGIIIDKNANLATLLGTLKEFYRKMGFDRVKFKPSFFPYTEPSTEVFVFMKSKNSWIELGGAGIFRPEVTEPFGCTVPVLAWGLGLERLAMMRYDINDIRELYWSDLDKIKEIPLCR